MDVNNNDSQLYMNFENFQDFVSIIKFLSSNFLEIIIFNHDLLSESNNEV